jgi:hypothetical protein
MNTESILHPSKLLLPDMASHVIPEKHHAATPAKLYLHARLHPIRNELDACTLEQVYIASLLGLVGPNLNLVFAWN